MKILPFVILLACMSCVSTEESGGTDESDAGIDVEPVCCGCVETGQKCGLTGEGICRSGKCYHSCVLPSGTQSRVIESCNNPCDAVGLETWEN